MVTKKSTDPSVKLTKPFMRETSHVACQRPPLVDRLFWTDRICYQLYVQDWISSYLRLWYLKFSCEYNTTLREGRGNLILVSKICNPRWGLPSRRCCKCWTRGWDSESLPQCGVWLFFSFLTKNVQNMSKTHNWRDFSRLLGIDVLWRHRWITSGMSLSHPPGWDNISPDVKIGGYSCLKSENMKSHSSCVDLTF